jgi:hypothetical protein
MPWVRIPPENHPLFRDALPDDTRVETLAMFGGVAAKVNGNLFAGLFGRSTMVWLPEPARAEALALEGASLFDPMGNGSVRSDKVMLPESIMGDARELRRWIARAFEAAAELPPKAAKGAKKAGTAKKATKATTAAKGAKAAKATRAAKAAKPAPAKRVAKKRKR